MVKKSSAFICDLVSATNESSSSTLASIRKGKLKSGLESGGHMKAIQNKTIDFISFRSTRCFAGKACETFSSLFFLLPTHFKSFFFCRLFSDTFVMMCSKFALNVTNKFSNSEFRNVVCLVNSIFMSQSRKGGSGRPNVSKQCIIADVGTEKITSSFLINFDRDH